MVVLRYTKTFAKRNTCFLVDDAPAIKCRIGDSGDETIVEIPVRFRLPREGARAIRPLSDVRDAWLIEATPVRAAVASMPIEIVEVPASVASVLEGL